MNFYFGHIYSTQITWNLYHCIRRRKTFYFIHSTVPVQFWKIENSSKTYLGVYPFIYISSGSTFSPRISSQTSLSIFWPHIRSYLPIAITELLMGGAESTLLGAHFGQIPDGNAQFRVSGAN